MAFHTYFLGVTKCIGIWVVCQLCLNVTWGNRNHHYYIKSTDILICDQLYVRVVHSVAFYAFVYVTEFALITAKLKSASEDS